MPGAAEAFAEGVGVGTGGGGGAGRTALLATPSTEPSAALNTGFGAGTNPIAAALAASACGADSSAMCCDTACARTSSDTFCRCSCCISKDPCASQVFTKSTSTKPPASKNATSTTNGARAGVRGVGTARSDGWSRFGRGAPGLGAAWPAAGDVTAVASTRAVAGAALTRRP